jgi:tripartite-type tricarboxylate transporter receptor subunit TctC
MYTDLLGGATQFSFITTLPVIEHIRAGKLRALAMTSDKRIEALPDVPTVEELGYPKLVLEAWSGLLAPKGTPRATVVAINAAVNRALKKPSVITALSKVGADPLSGSPEDFAKLYASQIEHWGDVVKRAGIKVE